MRRPSRENCSLGFPPMLRRLKVWSLTAVSASMTVGRMSSEMTGVSIVRPPLNFAGQLTIQGVRIPPS